MELSTGDEGSGGSLAAVLLFEFASLLLAKEEDDSGNDSG
jgi:hypothetical protein